MIFAINTPVETRIWQIACLHCERKYGVLTLIGDEQRPDQCSYCGHHVIATPREVHQT